MYQKTKSLLNKIRAKINYWRLKRRFKKMGGILDELHS